MKWGIYPVLVIREGYGRIVQFKIDKDGKHGQFRECSFEDLKCETIEDVHALSDCLQRPKRPIYL